MFAFDQFRGKTQPLGPRQQAYLAALLRERGGYVQERKAARVAAVDEQIRKLHLSGDWLDVQAGDDVRVAARRLRTELQSTDAAVRRLLAEGKFPRAVTLLPAQRWGEYEELLARENADLYAAVADAYVRADAFNRMTVDRANLYVGRWVDFHPDDDMEGFLQAISDAISALDEVIAASLPD
jgi:hypothetical protein